MGFAPVGLCDPSAYREPSDHLAADVPHGDEIGARSAPRKSTEAPRRPHRGFPGAGKLLRLSPLRRKRTFPAWTRAYRHTVRDDLRGAADHLPRDACAFKNRAAISHFGGGRRGACLPSGTWIASTLALAVCEIVFPSGQTRPPSG